MPFYIPDDCKVYHLDVTAVKTDVQAVECFFTDRHFPCGENGNLEVIVRMENSRRMTYIEESRRITDEKYILTLTAQPQKICAEIVCSAPRGLYYALCDLYRQIQTRTFRLGEREEYPLFSMRGYIEGFYGKPWLPEQRTDMLFFLSAYRMNTYFYAPKDDPYHREKWSVLYPEAELAQLRTLVQRAEKCFVDFWFCIAPGLDICYSSETQFDALLCKCRQLYNIGVRRFGLLLDDIPETMTFPEDIEKYGETVQAHIDLANRFYDAIRAMDPQAQVALCPLQYHGTGSEYYISKLGQGIEPDIFLFWTGHNICSQELTVPEAVTFSEHTRHKPLYWDNFPVNDAEMYQEMHLGWCYGREPELYRYSAGLIANCMPYFEANKIPLLTVADYLWNPVLYDPEKSWLYALQTAVGDDAEIFVEFAEHVTTSCLKTDVSARMAEALAAVHTAYLTGDVKTAALQISAYAARVRACCELLRKRKGDKLYTELSHWIEKYLLFGEGIALCNAYFQSKDETIKPALQEKLRQFLEHPAVMTDFAYRAAVEWLLQTNIGGTTK